MWDNKFRGSQLQLGSLIPDNSLTPMFFFSVLTTVTTLPTQPAADSNDACWSPLLGGNAIARDYPIPERRDEVGLELPFSLMMELVGEVLSKMYDKGIYIYF
jgi:hypothetical protein